MRKISLLLALVAGIFAGQARADFTAKDASAATITFKNSGDCTSVVCVVQQQPIDSTGAAFGVTANPFFMTIGSGKVVSGAYASGSIADGAVVTLGAKADAAWDGSAASPTLMAVAKYTATGIYAAIPDCGATPCTNKIGVVGVNTWGGSTLGAGSNFGTTPGAVVVPGVNASMFMGTAIVSATNGLYSNLLQGNVALSATNGIFANCLIGNVACDGNSGNKSAQTQRHVIATDQLALATWGHGATGAAVPSGVTYQGVLDASGGTNMLGLAGDPCQTSVKTTVPFTLATAAVKVAITGVSAKKIYVCAYELTNNAADSVAIFEATTATTCATSPVAVVGAGTTVATAATGFNFAANGGIARGNGGAQVLQTATNANDLCVAQSAATQLTGSFTYVTR